MLLEVKNLNKKFGSVTAANNINFKMNKNEIIGVIGANGAGKSTTIKMLAGQLAPSSGTVVIAGVDVVAGVVARAHSGGAARGKSLRHKRCCLFVMFL